MEVGNAAIEVGINGVADGSVQQEAMVDALHAEGNSWRLPYGPEWAVLCFEFMTERTMRVLSHSIRSAVALIVILYIILIALDEDVLWTEFGDSKVFVANLPLGCVGVATVSGTTALFCYRLWLVRAHGQRWAPRRWRLIPYALWKAAATMAMLITYVTANSYIISNPCILFVHPLVWIVFARLTAANVLALVYVIEMHDLVIIPARKTPKQPDRFVGSHNFFKAHWPEIAVFLAFQMGTIVSIEWYLSQDEIILERDSDGICRPSDDDCDTQKRLDTTERSGQSVSILYGILMVIYCLLALRRLRARPYQDFKLANIKLRLLYRTHLLALLLYNIAFTVSANLGPDVCDRRDLILYSFPPVTVTMTVVTMLDLVMYLPKHPSFQPRTIVADQQLVAWSKPEELQLRKHLMEHAEGGADMPLFCMETALKLFRWAVMVYDYTEIIPSDFLGPELHFMRDCSMPMSWDGLKHIKLFWDAEREAKAVMAWNDDTILVTFRGSAATANFVADATVVQTIYPRDAVLRCWTQPPMVHLGFLQTWQALSLQTRSHLQSPSSDRPQNARLGNASDGAGAQAGAPARSWAAWLWRDCCGMQPGATAHPVAATSTSTNQVVREIFTLMEIAPGGPDSVKLYFTGHSLGGALATLAAFDVQRSCNLRPEQIQVYTFGCPRQGNHAFAKLYDAALPHTWHVVNDCDMVCRSMKLMGTYKRAGQRSIVNDTGQLVVRPCYIELSLLQPAFAGSVVEHFLGSYRQSLLKVLDVELTHATAPERVDELRRIRAMILSAEEAEAKHLAETAQQAQAHTCGDGASPASGNGRLKAASESCNDTEVSAAEAKTTMQGGRSPPCEGDSAGCNSLSFAARHVSDIEARLPLEDGAAAADADTENARTRDDGDTELSMPPM